MPPNACTPPPVTGYGTASSDSFVPRGTALEGQSSENCSRHPRVPEGDLHADRYDSA